MKEKNVETSAPKKSKKKLILLLSIIFLLLVSAGVGIAWKSGVLTFGGGSDKCTLYWNVAEQTYLTGAGFSARQVEDDGYYHVTLAVDGEQVEYKVKDKKLVDDIDNRDIMGLEVDEDGVITAVYDPKEVCDGESISEWYVVSVGEDSFKVRQTKGAESGLSYDVKMTESTGIYDVTGAGKVGAEKTLEANDCVRVFRSFEKEVVYVFVVRGADYFTGNIVQDYCEHCDAQVDWHEWTEKNAVPVTTRHWRLTNDIVLTYQADIKDYQDVVIDLNGHTIESIERRRVFCVGDSKAQGILSIVDQSTEGTGTLKTTGEAPHGGIVHIKAGTCNFYSGTMDASETVASSYGLGVYLVAGTTFNMHGGTIIGGTSVGGRTYQSKFIGGGGGAVYVMGTFNMYGGTIRDGKAVAYRNNTGGYNWGIGGNVDVRNAATFNMEGGEILNGTADRSGGNVYVTANTATFTMRGGVISDGRCITSGGASGNVFVGQNSVFQFEDGTIKNGTVYKGGGGNIGVYGTMIMSGGHVTGGLSVDGETFETAKKREDMEYHNVYCNSSGVVDMSGGTVDGYMRINTKECMIKVSGTARITGADYNLSLGMGVEMRIGELTKGAKIGVTGGGFISEKTSSKYLAYVKSDYDEVDIQYYKSKFFMGKIDCLCGGSHVNSDGKVVAGHYGTCDGTVLEWMPWGNKASAPTVSGNWYLVADVQLTAQKGLAVDTKMALDLNGHTIKGKEDTRVYYIAKDRNAKMTILDTSAKQTGKIVSHGEKTQAGSCILVMPGNEVVMYSGIMDASEFKEIGAGGTTLTIRTASKFTMYGGTLVGGVTTKTGGTVVSQGIFELHDGIIKDGKAAVSGGNIYVSDGEFKMLGGKIINGSANYYNAEGKAAGAYDKGVGGNLYIKGPNKNTYVNATITGGTIEGGQSNGRGGNVHAHQYVNLVLGTEKGQVKNAAVISGGESVSGGNVFARADSTIAIYDGITIQDGIASNQGGNIFFDSNKEFVINGGIIENGTAKNGGNIHFSAKVTAMLRGGIVSGGKATAYGGNISNVGILNVSGTTIADGTAAARGGNIYTNGDITMTAGIITGGKAIAEKPTFEFGVGGNICAAGTKKENYVTVTVIGGTIEKGEANGRGGNISAHAYANLVLGTKDATSNDLALITEGKSTASSGGSGGNLFVRGDSTLTIYNGITVRDGESKYQGGNLSFDSSKTFAMNGGAFEGGISKDGGSISFSSKFNGAIAGGTISGGTATEEGGNIFNQGTLTVSGGTITGGTATNGGSIYTSKMLNVEGGIISNGFATAKGGNIYTTGDITMTGGIITGGKAEAEKPTYEFGIGGNILAAGADKDHYANVTITGGTIEKGEANGRGGNIDAHTFANLVLGTKDAVTNDLVLIAEGKSIKSSGATGGNIFARDNSTLVINNGVTVCDGEAKYQGGNIHFDSNKEFTMNGGIVEGGTARLGGNISFSNRLDGTISGGSIIGGSATEYGGNIYNKGKLLVKDTASVNYGTATNGGNIYNEGTVQVEGAAAGENTTVEPLKTVLKGKNISVLGDSISTYKGISNGDIADTTNSTIKGNKNYYTTELLPSWQDTYWGHLVDKYNMNLLVNNSASGGYILTDRSDSQLSGITRCTELHDNTGDNAGTEPDIIAVYLGTNDLIKGTELGELADATYNAVKAQSGEYITPTTFTEGYIILLDKIVNRYKNADVFCFTLLPTSNSESNKTLLNDYNVRIREIAEHYKVSVVDIASESGITLENYKLLQTGSHPLEAGMSWMADVFERALGTKYGVEISPYIANISKGAATNGGNIYVASNASLVIKSGVIREGYASTDTSNPGMGGNIFNQGTLTVSGGTITGGTATNGGNIYLYAVRSDATTGSGATMTMDGDKTTISDGKAVLGGNIYIDRGIFQAEDGTYTSTPATMTMNGGTIENGWAIGTSGNNKAGGGNIYCVGLFTMNGGKVQGGKAGSSTNTAVIGGNIYVYRGANVKGHVGKILISAGSILDGRATSNRGANIMLDHAEMEIKPTGVIKITGGKKATIDESGVVTSATGVSNVELYNNPKNPILISGNLFEGSEIGFRINGTISTATTIATIDTTVTQDASTIASFFKSDPTNHEVKGSGTKLTYGKKAE